MISLVCLFQGGSQKNNKSCSRKRKDLHNNFKYIIPMLFTFYICFLHPDEFCRSSTYAGLLYKDGHMTHYASRRTTFRSASFKTQEGSSEPTITATELSRIVCLRPRFRCKLMQIFFCFILTKAWHINNLDLRRGRR